MRLSTPNQLAGTIVEVTLGTVMATVKCAGGDQVVTASITDDAAMAQRSIKPQVRSKVRSHSDYADTMRPWR